MPVCDVGIYLYLSSSQSSLFLCREYSGLFKIAHLTRTYTHAKHRNAMKREIKCKGKVNGSWKRSWNGALAFFFRPSLHQFCISRCVMGYCCRPVRDHLAQGRIPILSTFMIHPIWLVASFTMTITLFVRMRREAIEKRKTNLWYDYLQCCPCRIRPHFTGLYWQLAISDAKANSCRSWIGYNIRPTKQNDPLRTVRQRGKPSIWIWLLWAASESYIFSEQCVSACLGRKKGDEMFGGPGSEPRFLVPECCSGCGC